MPRPTGTTPIPPPSPEWHESQYLVDNGFEKLAERRVDLKITLDAVERELKDLNLEIGAMLTTAGEKTVRYGNHRITVGFSSTGGRLMKERLLELGVPMTTIEEATTPKGFGNPYVTVTEITGPGD